MEFKGVKYERFFLRTFLWKNTLLKSTIPYLVVQYYPILGGRKNKITMLFLGFLKI